MKTEKIQEIVDAALLEGMTEAECTECGISIQCRPDASTAWCDNCNKTVQVRNYLIEQGYF